MQTWVQNIALKLFSLILAASLPLSVAYAQSNALYEMSLAELLNEKITVASKKEETIRSSPGVVTLITSEEIMNSGARDLIDVFQLIPGFNIALDTQGVVSLGFRGNWGHEGKILLIIDGQEMNELLYNTLQLGNHYPVDLIERIEIIRGPGSAVYGGNAELAVVKITTKGAEQLKGGYLGLSYGQMQKTFGNRNLSFGFGNKFDDWKVSVLGFVGQGNRSDRDYTDTNQNTYSMADNSRLDSHFFNIGVSNKGLELRAILDLYQTTTQDAYGTNLSRPVRLDFNSYLLGGKYTWNVTEKLSIIPELYYRRSQTWNSTDSVSQEVTGMYYDKVAQRVTAKLSANYKVSDQVSLLSGVEAYQDHAQDNSLLTGPGFGVTFDGASSVVYQDQAVYSQISAESFLGSLTLGGRYEYHSAAGGALVPRLSLVKAFDKLHLKGMYSGGYRAPSIENIRTNNAIRPETVWVGELEAGYSLTESLYFTVNAYDIRMHNTIVYNYEDGDSYKNFDKGGTRGIETELKYRTHEGYSNLNYSFYSAPFNSISSYSVPDRSDLLLAFPAHKITLSSSYKLFTDSFRINPSIIYLSSRFGNEVSIDGDGLPTSNYINYGPVWLVNLYFSYQSLFFTGLNAGVGVFNLLDQKYSFIEPYTGQHNPLPAQSRGVVFNLNYSVKL